MKLYAWQPKGHGELSLFVMAEDEAMARAAVEAEILRQVALEADDEGYYGRRSFDGWGTDYYVLTVAEAEQVLLNHND